MFWHTHDFQCFSNKQTNNNNGINNNIFYILHTLLPLGTYSKTFSLIILFKYYIQ